MNKIILIIVTLSFSLHSYGNKIIKDNLKELDRLIEKRYYFENIKKQQILNIKKQLKNKDTSIIKRYNLYANLYNEYRSYKYDSAYYYAGQMLLSAQKLQNTNLIADSKMALSFSCMSAGLFKEAAETAYSINPEQLNCDRKASLYLLLFTLNIDMANYTGVEPFLSEYKRKAFGYSKLINNLNIPKKAPEFSTIKIQEYQLKNNYSAAINLARHTLNSNLNERNNAIISSILGFCYLMQKDTTNAISYFFAASMSDIRIATKETSAIRQLAELLYLKGDLQHAYNYAKVALDDANFYNSRFRKIEIGHVLPIIEAERFSVIEQQKNKLLLYSIIISILGLLFMTATIIILKQKRKSNLDKKTISSQNKELLESNRRLKDVHRIKDEYIGYFFTANSSYIEKTEDFQKVVIRMIKNRKFEELIRLADSENLEKERKDMFSLFDQIFLRLFPDFINQYNLLFEEEDRVVMKDDKVQLTPEIRIFALIRLGISNNESIAKFLNLSLSTIKNYKTKVKNRSNVPNELFEQKIMEIGYKN
mgnify:CR=1 FL=1